MGKYNPLCQPWGATSVFLFLSPESFYNLITWHHWKKEKATKPVVPHLESGFPTDIKLSIIDALAKSKVNDKYLELNDIQKTTS
jgi:hypothetical protein